MLFEDEFLQSSDVVMSIMIKSHALKTQNLSDNPHAGDSSNRNIKRIRVENSSSARHDPAPLDSSSTHSATSTLPMPHGESAVSNARFEKWVFMFTIRVTDGTAVSDIIVFDKVCFLTTKYS